LQSSSFYKERITISDKNYINPISKGSTGKYFFLIEDTTYTDNNDTVFIISYRPLKNTNFDGMKGVLSINSNGWAIQNVIAEPSRDEGGVSITIQQMYEWVEDRQWFPVQLNTELRMKNVKVNQYAPLGIGKSYISKINLEPGLSKKEFGNIEVDVDPNATHRKQGYWDAYRIDSLSLKEKNTYHFIDSIGEAENFDRLAKSFGAIMSGRIPFGYVYLDLDKLLKYNDFEGFAPGLGIHTSKRLSERFTLGGYWRYGFRDKTAKYGGDLSIYLDKYADYSINFMFADDVTETGNHSFFDDKSTLANTDSYRDFLINRMDTTYTSS